VAALIATVATFLVVVAVASTVAAARFRRLADEAEQARANEQDERHRAEGLAEHNRLRLYASSMNLAQEAWERGDVGRVLELLENFRPQAGAKDLRGFEWYYLWRLCHDERFTLRGDQGPVRGEFFAPNRAIPQYAEMGFGNRSPVRAAVYTPDGRTLATASADGAVRLWDPATGRELRTLQGSKTGVLSLAVSPDGKTLAAGDAERQVWLWDLATGEKVDVLGGRQELSRNIVNASLTLLLQNQPLSATACCSYFLTIPNGPVGAVAFSPDGRTLAAASGYWTIRIGNPVYRFLPLPPIAGQVTLWDLRTRKPVATLGGYRAGILSLAFSPDGRTLATGDSEAKVKLWDVARRREQVLWSEPTAQAVFAVAFSPDGQTLAAGSLDKTVRLWDVRTGQERRHWEGHRAPIFALAFAPDGQTLATAGLDQTVKLWEVGTGQERFSLKGHVAAVSTLAFAPGGRHLATGSWDGPVKLWDATRRQAGDALPGWKGGAYSLAFAPDGKTLAFASGKVYVWEVGAGRLPHPLPDYTDRQTIVGLSPDGKTLAAAGMSKTVQLWEVGTWRKLATLRGHTDTIWSLAFAPDGQTLATGGQDGTARLWDVPTGQQRAALRLQAGRQARSVAFSPDGQTLAVVASVWGLNYRSAVELWDLPTEQVRSTLRGHENLMEWVAFSPDGKLLATASWDKTAKLWDAATGQELATLTGHTDVIYHGAFSPDGKTLATASWDGTVKLWHVASRQQLLTLGGARDVIWCVAFSPDGKTLAMGTDSRQEAGAVVLWQAGTSGTVPVGETDLPPEAARPRSWIAHWVPSVWGEVLLKDELLSRLRQDRFLTETERRQALTIAEGYPDQATPEDLNNASWAVVRRSDADAAAYQLAWKQAEAACRLKPGDGKTLNTLGVAQYRLGQYPEALATLSRSANLNAARANGPLPADLAFLAMTHHRLGQPEQARDALVRLRDRLKDPRFAEDAASQAFLREAAALLEGPR
jgi:WD40 repeat protein